MIVQGLQKLGAGLEEVGTVLQQCGAGQVVADIQNIGEKNAHAQTKKEREREIREREIRERERERFETERSQ